MFLGSYQWCAIPAKVDSDSIPIPGQWWSIQFRFQFHHRKFQFLPVILVFDSIPIPIPASLKILEIRFQFQFRNRNCTSLAVIILIILYCPFMWSNHYVHGPIRNMKTPERWRAPPRRALLVIFLGQRHQMTSCRHAVTSHDVMASHHNVTWHLIIGLYVKRFGRESAN